MLEAGQAHTLEAQKSIVRNQEEIFGRLATLENNSNMYAPSYHRPQSVRIPPPPNHAPPMLDSSLDLSFDSPGGPIAPRNSPLRTFLHHQHIQLHLIYHLHHDGPLLFVSTKMIILGLMLMGMKILKQILLYPTIIHHLATRTTLKIVLQVESLEYVLPSVTCFRLPATLSVFSNRTIPLIRLAELELASAPQPHQPEKLPPSNCPHQKSTKANCCRRQQSFISIQVLSMNARLVHWQPNLLRRPSLVMMRLSSAQSQASGITQGYLLRS